MVSPPIIGSVYDGRAQKSDRDAAVQLEADITRLYGPSIKWSDYFAQTPKGRVAIRIRIVKLGASFGSRLVSSTAFASAVGNAQAQATGPWGSVVGSVSSQQTILAGSLSGEGWWNGAAWIDLEVDDKRGGKPIKFTLPIVAEHRESNMWGYVSRDKAARAAWDNASAQLTRAIDAIARTVRDQQG